MSLLRAIPGIVPTARFVSMPAWPQKTVRARNGRVIKWGLSAFPGNMPMKLEWANITFAEAEAIIEVWDLSYGTARAIEVPPEIFADADQPLAAYLMTAVPGGGWGLKSPPVVRSVKNRRCSVEIECEMVALRVAVP